MTQWVLHVDGMHCGGCVASVERALTAVEGVDQVSVDLAQGLVSVAGNASLQREPLAEAVQALGFDVLDR